MKENVSGCFFNTVYIPNFVQIGKTFCGWRDILTGGQTLRPALLGRLKCQPKKLLLLNDDQELSE